MQTDLQLIRPRAIRVDRRVLVFAETVLAAILAFAAIGTRSFWLDESVSVTMAKLDWGSLVHELRVREGNMSLYHLLLFGWIRLGDSELFVRSLSALAAVATVPLGYLLTRRLAGTRAALLAGLLLAVNPMVVRYAQEARGYALCLLLVTAGSYLFVLALDRPTWPLWLGYAAVVALAGYAHDFALLIPPAHAVSLAFLRRDLVPWRKVAGAACTLVLLLVPLLYLLASNDSSGIEWATGNAPGRIFTRIHDHRPVAAAVLVAGLVATVLAWLGLRRFGVTPLNNRRSWRWAFLLSWLITPLAAVAVLAVVYRPLFVVRYFIICLPAVVILAALVVAQLLHGRIAAAAASALVAISLLGVLRWYANGESENWRHATSYVVQKTRRGDGVLFYAPYVRIPFTLYARLDHRGHRLPPPVYPSAGWRADAMRFNSYIPVTADAVRSRAAHFERIWLVVSHANLYGGTDPGYDAVRAGLAEAGFRRAAVVHFAGIDVLRYATH